MPTVVTKNLVKSLYPKRLHESHKGDFGRLLIIGGSRLYSGSPALAGLAAMRTGVDLVTIAAPERPADIIASFSPNLITYPVDGDSFTPLHLKETLNLAKNADAIVIGGGMGRDKKTLDFVLQFMEKTMAPCVIDADAIHAFRGNNYLLKPSHIITPHIYEFFILTETRQTKKLEERISLAKSFAEKVRTTVLLKGHVDVIASDARLAINKTGNPYMTVGGTGDVLAGICGALLANQSNTFDAACAAAYINGAAGDIAAKEFGPGLTATDVIEKIPKVLS